MRMAIAFTLIFLTLTPAMADDPPTEPRKYLDWWYKQFEAKDAEPRSVGAWSQQVKQLNSDKPEERETAAKFLRDVAALSIVDESTGKAPPVTGLRFLGIYSGYGQKSNYAHMWRTLTQQDFFAKDVRPELFPLLAWYVESETDGELQIKAVELLDSFDNADADKLRLKLAAGKHPNAQVITLALKQLSDHKQKLPANELLTLCQHHRMKVREAARELNTVQGGKDPDPFDPVKAMQSPAMKAVLAELQKWTPDVLPAKDAKLIEVTFRHVDEAPELQLTQRYFVWLIEQKENSLKVLFPYGHSHEYNHDGMGFLRNTIVASKMNKTPVSAKTVADSFVNQRKEWAESLDKRDRPAELCLSEINLGVWLMQTGQTADAARVFLPMLETFETERELFEFTRMEIGSILGWRMLLTFGDNRDFAGTLKLARHIDAVYRGTRYHPHARRFLAELPKRTDDRTIFKLPTPEEWNTLKTKLSREQQIDYLVTRLRLIQMEYSTGESQFADADRKQPLINPYGELVGDRPKSEGLKLTVKDIPFLAKHIKNDWLLISAGKRLCGFGNPVPEITTDRDLLLRTIDQLAGHDLTVSDYNHKDRWSKLTSKEINGEINRITNWAKSHELLSEIDLQWAIYKQELKAEAGFFKVSRRLEKLMIDKSLSKERRAEVLESMKQFYKQIKNSDDSDRRYILEAFRDYEPKAGLDFAEVCLKEQVELPLKEETRRLRFVAAQIIFAAGDKENVRALLGEELATTGLDGRFNVWEPAVRLLLKDGSKESLTQAVRLFENKDLVRVIASHGRAELFQRYVAAGRTEPYQFYLKQFDDEKTAERFADEIVKEFAKDDPDVKKIVVDHPKTADRIPHVKKWLDSKLSKK